ncbi:MAG: alpha/beta hydrolase [Bacteroides sp.]|nr:alpha/beta hydrolase [Bacteroides sp.]
MKKKSLSWMLALVATQSVMAAASVSGNDVALKFNPQGSTDKVLRMPDGKTVKYRAYEHIYYVTNVEDSTYQYLNFYVPESVYASGNDDVPILLRTYVGGYMAAKAMEPSGTDATGRALLEGYAVCIPGARGSNSIVEKNGKQIYTGRIPAGLLDLKAAVRYLRLNDGLMPGNAEKIITDGTSAGGAMSSLLESTGNSPLYDDYLKKMGAADARDDVFAAVCYCPITDLEHADMAYEWLYQCTNTKVRQLTEEQQKISAELAEAYPAYLNSLQLKAPDGTLLTADNYLDYVKSFLIQSVQRARNEGCDIPDSIGITLNERQMPMMGNRPPAFDKSTRFKPKDGIRRPDAGNGTPTPPTANNRRDAAAAPADIDARQAPSFGPQGITMHKEQGEFVLDIDMPTYLNYVATTAALKLPPAFDTQGVLPGNTDSAENRAFGNAEGSSVNFTAYAISKATNGKTQKVDEALRTRIYLINPMNFIADAGSTKAQHWYIRHGARDRDTSFCVPINLATKLMNCGYDVDFRLPWNRPHSGDYNLDDLFEWIGSVTR